MSDCIFCKIVARQIPAEILFEDETVVAFADIHPQSPTHILVIPRKHIPRLCEARTEDAGLIANVFLVIQHLVGKFGLAAAGYRVVVNDGAAAGQAVDHLHFHVLGGRSFNWPPG
jgi:histidine triad (HIT) family protein